MIDDENVDDDRKELLDELLDKKCLEHDIYCIYSALLDLVVKFFEPAMPPRENEMDNDNDDESKTTDDIDKINYWNVGLFDSGLNSSLYLKLHYLQHKLLKNFDLILYTHFENIGLSPQLYMLRWIRVLFSREFYLDQTIKLWDNLFVSKNILEFIDYIVMAMIYNVRDKLLKKNDMSAIQILQNYPRNNINMISLSDAARKIQNGEIIHSLNETGYIISIY